MCVLNQIFGEESTRKHQLLKKSQIQSCVFLLALFLRLPLVVLENSMSDELYHESLDVSYHSRVNNS